MSISAIWILEWDKMDSFKKRYQLAESFAAVLLERWETGAYRKGGSRRTSQDAGAFGALLSAPALPKIKAKK